VSQGSGLPRPRSNANHAIIRWVKEDGFGAVSGKRSLGGMGIVAKTPRRRRTSRLASTDPTFECVTPPGNRESLLTRTVTQVHGKFVAEIVSQIATERTLPAEDALL
jgi:hypothetical protein